ncbi:MAG: NAD-dependent epimerase/dehydratase family protein, partial [Pseudobdellovibrio sp.]
SLDANNGQRGHGSQRVIFAATEAALKAKSLVINGSDYDTEDGSCVRDYIHVEDVADIHVKALEYIEKNKCQHILNCGYGEGYSVRQIVDIFKKVNNTDFKVETGPRRIGDPEFLVGDNSELIKLLRWKSKFTNPIEVICKTAYEWGKKHSLG